MLGRTPHSCAWLLASRCALVVSVTLGMLGASLPAAAQPPPKVFRVGHLAAPGRTPDGAPPRVLREALRELGYVEGQNIAYEARFAEGKLERLPDLAAELVRLKVDVIVTQGGGVDGGGKASDIDDSDRHGARLGGCRGGWMDRDPCAPRREHHRFER